MRVLSRFGRYGVQIVPQINEAYATGITKVVQPPVYALFREGLMTKEERQLAHELWGGNFNGFYQEQDEVTVVAPEYRIGVFDSKLAQTENQWSDDVRKHVESELARLAVLQPGDLHVVPERVLAPPWPAYDHYQGEVADLMKKILDDGYRWEDVLAYERENQNRPEIVTALSELSGMLAEPELEEVLG